MAAADLTASSLSEAAGIVLLEAIGRWFAGADNRGVRLCTLYCGCKLWRSWMTSNRARRRDALNEVLLKSADTAFLTQRPAENARIMLIPRFIQLTGEGRRYYYR